MPRATRNPPPHDALVDFLRDRRDRHLDEVAALLMVSRDDLRRRAAEEGALEQGETVRWRDAARWLLDVWPAPALAGALEADPGLVGLQPLPLVVTAPAYVLHALRVQWQSAVRAGEVRPLTFADYVAGLLQDAVDPSTVEMLRHDADFMRAYEFPEHEPDA